MIHYTDLELDFMHRSQGTAEECIRMARVFLLYLLEAYLFANGGQTVSLRWLALFCDFERAQTANQKSMCLAYFYSSLDSLSQGTLCQLVRPWKLLEVSFSPFTLVGHAFSFLQSYIHMPHRLGLCTIFLPTTFLHISCKLLPYQIYVLQIVPYLILANYHIVNSTINFCKLFFLYLANCHLSNYYF